MIVDGPILLEDILDDSFDPASGGVVTFYGVVRSPSEGREVRGILYECYRAMAEAEIDRIITDIKAAHPVAEVRVIHRIGEVATGEVSMVVVVSAEHRREAFVAAQDVIDRVKRSVPIWKKELYSDATSRWR